MIFLGLHPMFAGLERKGIQQQRGYLPDERAWPNSIIR